ncbi:DUF192 domain-containing protein [Paracoccus marcusii]|nr:DUF192 domain-containing protein [Paracoccus marcusii]
MRRRRPMTKRRRPNRFTIRFPMLRSSLAVALLLALAAPLAAQPIVPAADAQCRSDAVLIRTTGDTALSFQIEVADTPESRAQGLMFRRNLPAGRGCCSSIPNPSRSVSGCATR